MKGIKTGFKKVTGIYLATVLLLITGALALYVSMDRQDPCDNTPYGGQALFSEYRQYFDGYSPAEDLPVAGCLLESDDETEKKDPEEVDVDPVKPPPAPKPEPSPAPEPAPEPAPAPGPLQMTPDEQLMFDLVNRERESRGIPVYIWDDRLHEAARAKSKEMIELNYFSHDSPTLGDWPGIFKYFNISHSGGAENIAKNRSITNAHNRLMDSEGHMQNILNTNLTHAAIGIVQDPSGYYFITQLFIKPK